MKPRRGDAVAAPATIRSLFAAGVEAGAAGKPRPDPATAELAALHGWRCGRNASGRTRGGRGPDLSPTLAHVIWREIEAIALADAAMPADAAPRGHWAWPGRV